jgi:uncharacterized protein (DUF697 family)
MVHLATVHDQATKNSESPILVKMVLPVSGGASATTWVLDTYTWVLDFRSVVELQPG